MQRPRIFEPRVLELAIKLPKRMPEPFKALEEYDRTLKLRKWDNKVRVNFTIDPTLYRGFRDYCQKHGYKMSSLIEKAMKDKLQKAANI